MKDTMTVIELLNKISNKEEVPKRIKYGIYEYEWVIDRIISKWSYARKPLVGNCMIPFKDDVTLSDWEVLNSTVTILKYDEPLKELKMLNCTDVDIDNAHDVDNITEEAIISDIQTLQTWVNKIIKKINKEGK